MRIVLAVDGSKYGDWATEWVLGLTWSHLERVRVPLHTANIIRYPSAGCRRDSGSF